MTTTRQHDNLNRLRSVSSAASGETLPLAFSYQYNDANQRIRASLADGSFWIYEYDSLGQVQSGKKYWNDSTPVAGQQFEYGHDDIGNRKTAAWGGNQNGNNLRTTGYAANGNNQYTSRTNSGHFNVIGQVNPNAALTLNGSSSGLYRRGEYYRREFSVTNSGGPVYSSVTNVATFGGSSETKIGGVYVPKLVEAFAYDADGNLLSDSQWDYVWDAENRLIKQTMKTGTGILGITRKELVFDYDWMGRRIQKRTYYRNAGNTDWVLEETRRFAYDEWNLVAELDGSNNLVRTYVWGLDLSGSLQGAGGVGGLLMVTEHPSEDHYIVAYDGNGNVAGLVKAGDGTYAARYEYGPFGEPSRASGPAAIAANNPFRFSTKYCDAESGLLYYGYRYYDPTTGRWPSRDPIAELGGQNLYTFVLNQPISLVDILGLSAIEEACNKHVIAALETRAVKKITKEILDRGCSIPPVTCDCCSKPKQAGTYNPVSKTIKMCYRGMFTKRDYAMTILHEMYHALDDCRGKGTSCSDSICSEIVAYFYADCANTHPRIQCAIYGMQASMRGTLCALQADYFEWSEAQACLKEFRQRPMPK